MDDSTRLPGKVRGLQTTANSARIFTILALDHGAALAEAIHPEASGPASYEEVVAVKTSVLDQLAQEASAVLLDPVYGLGPAVLGGHLPGQVGLMLSVEDGDYAQPRQPARLLDDWDVGKIKQAGAAAVKCFFYYHPGDKNLAPAQEAFVTDLVTACRYHDLPLFAEPISYNVTPEERTAVVVESARCLCRLGIDVLKAEFPIDVHAQPDESAWTAACQALSQACTVPWVLLSAGVDFPTFERQVGVACRAGASGYLAGRAIWKEVLTLRGDEQTAFLRNTGVERLQALAAIATEHGRPWTDFYPYSPAPLARGWYAGIGKTGRINIVEPELA